MPAFRIIHLFPEKAGISRLRVYQLFLIKAILKTSEKEAQMSLFVSYALNAYLRKLYICALTDMEPWSPSVSSCQICSTPFCSRALW